MAQRSALSRPRKIKAFLWKIGCLILILPIYVMVVSEGSRVLIPALAQRLYRIPGLGILRNYESSYRLDLAHAFSIVLCFFAFHFWTIVLWMVLAPGEYIGRKRWNPETYARIIKALAFTILGADAIFFYTGITQQSGGIFGGSIVSFTAIIATIAYVAVLIGIALVYINLDRD